MATAIICIIAVIFVLCALAGLVPKEQRPNARIVVRAGGNLRAEVVCRECGVRQAVEFDAGGLPVVVCRECGAKVLTIFDLESQRLILAARREKAEAEGLECKYCGSRFDPDQKGHLHDGDFCEASGCTLCPTSGALKRFLEGKAFCCQECESQYIAETPYCRVCGCSDEDACEGGCWWVEDPEGLGDLCSACAEKMVEAAAGKG